MSTPDEPDREPAQDDERPRTVRDNWWWSGGLWLVAGVAIAGYQWDSVTGKIEGFWGNWVMFVIGAGIAVAGAWRLWQSWLVERDRRAQPPSP